MGVHIDHWGIETKPQDSSITAQTAYNIAIRGYQSMCSKISDSYANDSGRSENVIQQCNWSQSEELSLRIVEAVAELKDVESTELEPLGRVIDTDALDRLFTPSGESKRQHGTVGFEYEGYHITVTADGEILISAER